jgi:hypothetical protein
MKYIEKKLKKDASEFKQNYDEVLHNKIMSSLPQQSVEHKKLFNGFSLKPLIPALLAMTVLLYIGFGLNETDTSSSPIELEIELVELDALTFDLFTLEEKAINTITEERQAILDDFAYIQNLIVL